MKRKKTEASQSVTNACLQTVTPCEDARAATGWVQDWPVREVTAQECIDADLAAEKGIPDPERVANWKYLKALRILFYARETKDRTLVPAAANTIYPHLPADVTGGLRLFGDDKWVKGFIADDSLKERRFQIPWYVSQAVQDCCLCVYVPGDMISNEVLRPPVHAMFCKTFEAAVACKLFANGLGVCLYCGTLFQKIRPKQQCCSESHVKAYRTRRWRQPKEETQTKKRGGRQ